MLVKDAQPGDRIKVNGRLYVVAAPCPIIGEVACYNVEGVKVKVHPSLECEYVGKNKTQPCS